MPRIPRKRAVRRRGGRQSGFTLVELLIACGLMAALALLSWRGLDTVIQSRERLTAESDRLRSLTLAFSQLDEDLLRSWPVRLFDLGEPVLRVQVTGDRQEQSLHLLRESNRTGEPTRVQRVVYEVRDGQLMRGFSEWSRPAPDAVLGGGFGGAGGAVQALVWQPILTGVRAIAIRGYVSGKDWMDAAMLDRETERATQAMAAALTVQQAGTAASVASQAGAPGDPSTGTPSGGPTDAETKRAAAMVAAARQIAEQVAVIGVELQLETHDGLRYRRVYSVKD